MKVCVTFISVLFFTVIVSASFQQNTVVPGKHTLIEQAGSEVIYEPGPGTIQLIQLLSRATGIILKKPDVPAAHKIKIENNVERPLHRLRYNKFPRWTKSTCT